MVIFHVMKHSLPVFSIYLEPESCYCMQTGVFWQSNQVRLTMYGESRTIDSVLYSLVNARKLSLPKYWFSFTMAVTLFQHLMILIPQSDCQKAIHTHLIDSKLSLYQWLYIVIVCLEVHVLT